MKRTFPITLVALAALLPASASADSGSLHQLFADYDAWRLREFPEMAMERGDYTRADQITDNSLAAIERRYGDRRQFLERLERIGRDGLSAEDALYFELFDLELRTAIEGERFRTFLAPVGGRFGLQVDVPQMHVRSRFDSYDDYVNYLKRLEQAPRLIEDTLEALRQGVKEGRTPPRISLQGVPKQFEDLLNGGLRALATPLEKPGGLTEAERRALSERFEGTSFPAVHGAMRKLGAFITTEYLPKCRESIAASDWPDGQAYYAYMLRTMTTTDLTAQQIHDIGQREVARIRAEMLAVIRKTDFMASHPAAGEVDDARLFQEFVQYLRNDPRFYYKTPEELLAGYRDICKRIDAIMPKLFGKLPRLPYGVREIPAFMAPSQTTAYYQQGDVRNAQPGYFYANTYALEQRPKYEMIALAMHEAVPGHHHQIALAQELEGAPEFRKDAWFTAFGEGWALYSERLGLEHDLYADPYDDFGRLTYEMWRACRLVVDTGMHALGWSRDQAVKFMLENSALSELNINNEIDRYIGWPGQACAYKLGELKFRELRERAERRLGSRFDLRAFHDEALGAGTLPLKLLESRMDAWIEAQASKAGD